MIFISNGWNILIGLIKSFQITDALDVILVSLIIYSGIKLVRETRAGQLVKGIFVLLAGWVLSYYLHLHMLGAFLNYFFQFSVFALLVVFQPELRRATAKHGSFPAAARMTWSCRKSRGRGSTRWSIPLPSCRNRRWAR